MKNLEKKLRALDARISRISCRSRFGCHEYSFIVFSPSFRRYAVINFVSHSCRIYDDFSIIEKYRDGILDMSLDDICDAFDTFIRQFDFTSKRLTFSHTFTSGEYYAIDNKNISHLTFTSL